MMKLFKRGVVFVITLAMILSCFSGMSFAQGSAQPCFENVILNVGSDETQRNITWYSDTYGSGEVRYAEKSGEEFPCEYKTGKAIAIKAMDGRWIYKASMALLKENTEYIYCLAVSDNVSDCYSFNTKSFGESFSFGYITDPQLNTLAESGVNWGNTLEKITNEFPGISLFVSGGDQTSDPTKEAGFNNFIADTFKSFPVSTSIGPSHDTAQLYKEHYNLPNLSTKYGITDSSSDYFYTYNNCLFMHINAESSDFDGHIEFMKNAILSNSDCVWRIVVIHYSFLSGGHHAEDSGVKNARAALAGEMNELGVDVVLSGHDHSYARSYMMLDGDTIAEDVVENNSVTNPTGTMYICGTSASGLGFYNAVDSEDDKYIACKRTDKRNGFVNFDITDNSLTINSYFLDKEAAEKFDTFTINKTAEPFRLNEKTDMIEYRGVSIANAYAYSQAIIKPVDSNWAISLDNGESFESLGIAADAENYIIRINPDEKVWEYSQDGGASYKQTFISSERYTVKYVTSVDAKYGDDTDLSLYKERVFTSEMPDAPELLLPKGSLDEGFLYDWEWRYYSLTDGSDDVSEFEAGKEYVAYLEKIEIPVSHTMYIANTENPSEYTYTWKNIWELVKRCPGEEITLVLKENISLKADERVMLNVPLNINLDLNGKTLDATQLSVTYVFYFASGTGGSVFNVISSAKNAVIKADSKSFTRLESNTASVININLGSEMSYPITVSKCSYLMYSGGSFKNGATLNFNISNGSYNFTNGIFYVNNVTTTAPQNTYTINALDAKFNFSGSATAVIKNATDVYAKNTSVFNAENCSFINAYDNASRPILSADFWLGTMHFEACEFIGVSLDASKFASLKEMTLGEGCTFENSAATFEEGTTNFKGNNLKPVEGLVVSRLSADVLEIAAETDVSKITWANPIGYTEYWKKGVVPQYLGEESFVSGGVEYFVVLAETPTAADSDKTYLFKNEDGRTYRYNEEKDLWVLTSPDGEETEIGGKNVAEIQGYRNISLTGLPEVLDVLYNDSFTGAMDKRIALSGNAAYNASEGNISLTKNGDEAYIYFNRNKSDVAGVYALDLTLTRDVTNNGEAWIYLGRNSSDKKRQMDIRWKSEAASNYSHVTIYKRATGENGGVLAKSDVYNTKSKLKLTIKFDTVSGKCSIWVNGKLAAEDNETYFAKSSLQYVRVHSEGYDGKEDGEHIRIEDIKLYSVPVEGKPVADEYYSNHTFDKDALTTAEVEEKYPIFHVKSSDKDEFAVKDGALYITTDGGNSDAARVCVMPLRKLNTGVAGEKLFVEYTVSSTDSSDKRNVTSAILDPTRQKSLQAKWAAGKLKVNSVEHDDSEYGTEHTAKYTYLLNTTTKQYSLWINDKKVLEDAAYFGDATDGTIWAVLFDPKSECALEDIKVGVVRDFAGGKYNVLAQEKFNSKGSLGANENVSVAQSSDITYSFMNGAYTASANVKNASTSIFINLGKENMKGNVYFNLNLGRTKASSTDEFLRIYFKSANVDNPDTAVSGDYSDIELIYWNDEKMFSYTLEKSVQTDSVKNYSASTAIDYVFKLDTVNGTLSVYANGKPLYENVSLSEQQKADVLKGYFKFSLLHRITSSMLYINHFEVWQENGVNSMRLTEDNKLEFMICDDTENGVIHFADYNKNGLLTGLAGMDVSFKKGKIYSADASEFLNGYKTKIFLWKDDVNIMPLAESIER